MLNKYTTLINIMWQRGLAYRFTIFAYRIGEIAEMLVLLLMWSAIFTGTSTIQGYTLNEMLTYILFGNLVNTITRNFAAAGIGRDIKDGRLSLFLLKPMKHVRYALASEIGRASLPFVLSLITQLLVVLLFHDKFLYNTDPVTLLVILGMILLAFLLEFELSYLAGLIAFWTDEVDGLYTTMERVKKFFSGGYFPLSLLPATFITVSFALPFAYSFFVPAQLYLKKIDLSMGLKGLGVQLLWIVVLAMIIRVVWKRGIRKYEGVGI